VNDADVDTNGGGLPGVRGPTACEHLRVLGCPEGQPLEDGTTCEKFCKDTQENGQPLNPTRVMSITTCIEIEGCTRAR